MLELARPHLHIRKRETPGGRARASLPQLRDPSLDGTEAVGDGTTTLLLIGDQGMLLHPGTGSREAGR